jgi:hypothetical protein
VKLTPRRLLLLLAVLVLPAAIAARWQGVGEGGGPRFHPRPDALEYVAAAQAIAQTGRIYLQVGPLQVRPRYAPGWPLLLATTLRAGVKGPDLWRVTGLFGAALALLLAAVASSAVLALAPAVEEGKPPYAAALAAGLTAGWIWALAPIAVGVGRTALSDEPAALAAVASLVFSGIGFLAAGPRRATLPAMVGGLALGLAATLRPICAALLLPPLAILLAAALRRAGRRLLLPRAVAWALGVAVFPMAAIFLLHRSGLSPWEWSGYAFWLPERYGRISDTFRLRYALAPDESFRLGGSEPMSHLGVALRVLLGLPGLRVHHRLGLFWPILGWLAALPVVAAARRRGGAAGALAPWIAAVLALWTMGHVALFSLYFYPASRFYLAPLALCTALFATACGLGLAHPGLRSRLPSALAALIVLGLTLQGWTELQRARRPRRRDERTWSRFERWRSRSDAERAGRALPFDPLHAQALGLLTPEVVGSVHEWGTLPPTVHVRRLQDLGLLPR